MADDIATILGYEARTQVINNFQFNNFAFTQMFFNPSIIEDIDGRIASWDVLIADRTAGLYSAPGSPAHSVNLTPIRSDSGRLLRDYRKKDIPGEVLNQIRAPGSASKQAQGRATVAREQRSLAKNIETNKELHLSKTLTPGAQSYTVTDGRGSEVSVSITNTGINTITKSASWATAGTDILADIASAKAKAQEESGMDLKHAWCNSTFKGYFMHNTDIVNLLGGTNEAVKQVRGTDDVVIDGITFHFYDNTYTTPASVVTKFCADKLIWYHPEPSKDWITIFRGTELIAVDGALRESRGLASWTKVDDDPAGIILYALDNYLAVLTVPAAVCYSDVIT